MENKADNKKFFGNHETSILSLFDEDRHEEENFCDVIIVVDEKEFKGHRKILAKMSPVFKNMFKTEMKEKYDGLVNIKGINAPTMESIFHFIYKFEIEINSTNSLDLFAASDYLQIEGLKKICTNYLNSKMDCNSCLSVLGNTQIHDDNTIARASTFMSENFRKTTGQKEFKEFNKNAVIEIIKMIKANSSRYKVVNTTWIYEALSNWARFDINQRKGYFINLLKDLVDLNKLPIQFLKEVVLNEPLLCEIKQQITETLIEKINEKEIAEAKTDDKLFLVVCDDNSSKLFHLSDKAWEQLPNTVNDFTDSCFVLYKTKIFGFGCGKDYRDVLMLDLLEEKKVWNVISKTLKPRKNSKAILCLGMIYLTGGEQYGSSCEIFEPVSYSSINYVSLPNLHSNHACINYLEDYPLCLSSSSLDFLDREKCYWRTLQHMKHISVYENPVAVILERQIVLLQHTTYFGKMEWHNRMFHYFLGCWIKYPDLNNNYSAFDACNTNEKLFVCGSVQDSFYVEEFLPKQKAWKLVNKVKLNNKVTKIFALNNF